MKRWYLYILLILVSLGCVRELQQVEGEALEPFPEGEPVTLSFTVPDNVIEPATRATGYTNRLGEAIHLDSLYVAVFGSSGYLKEYVKAQNLKDTTDYIYIDDWGIERKVAAHTFTLTLTMSSKRRQIHFIGNGPSTLNFGYANEILPSLLSKPGDQSLWQVMSIDTIGARLENGRYVKDDKGVYQASERTEQQFRNIPLIKNWAKITVSVDTAAGFELKGYAVINVPTQGTVTPAYFNQTDQKYAFIETYQNWDFSRLTDFYPGNLPDNVPFNLTVPSQADFDNGTGGVVNIEKVKSGASTDSCLYMYERTVPNRLEPPTSVIIYGIYKNPDAKDTPHYGQLYYYKIDFMQDGEYYPIFRNFKYEIYISKVLAIGHTTPESAAASAGSADVSADVTTRHLPDISDGDARLIIQPWMSQSFVRRQVNNRVLHVKFFDDVMSGNPSMIDSCVTCELLPMEDGSEDLITSLSIDEPSWAAGTDMGWRTITFSTDDPGDKVRSQTIRITGTYQTKGATPVKRTLYRDVVITLQSLQEMTVVASVDPSTNDDVNVEISIPDGLVESMFPLDFIIEPEDLTLTPNNQADDNNLPVQSGVSLSEHAEFYGKMAFQFKRTLSWSEYNSLPLSMDADGNYVRTFVCKFKTTRGLCGTTVWVANSFFRKASDSFDNPTFNYFYIKAESTEGCTVKINKGNLQYKIGSGDWSDYSANSTINLAYRQRLFLKAKVETLDWSGKPVTVNGTFSIGGNLASLILGDDKEAAIRTTGWTFQNFMSGKTNLTDASVLDLPMLTVSNYGYKGFFSECTKLVAGPVAIAATTYNNEACREMFNKCSSLQSIPSFPSTVTLNGESCFFQMFKNCTSLTTLTEPLFNKDVPLQKGCFQDMFALCSSLREIPEDFLPATTLAENCYRGMFQSNTSLEKAPFLPAITLSGNCCYQEMFNGCTKLSYIKCLASNPGTQYTTNFTGGVAASGTFVRNSVLTTSWPTGANGIPDGWTVTTE